MLILGRREGESILIDGGIRIVVVSCDRGGVRIGIEAPASVKILRGGFAVLVATAMLRAASARVSREVVAARGLGPAVMARYRAEGRGVKRPALFRPRPRSRQ